MFNRAVQVKLVKPTKAETAQSDPKPQIDYVQIARESAKGVTVATVAIIGAYMGMDTLRQVTTTIVASKF